MYISNSSHSFRGKEPELPNFLQAHNQALGVKDPYVDNGLRYRSRAELHTARAFERAGVLYFPNARGRLSNREGQRINREPDFLVVWNGKFGILEVDGEDFHPTSRTVHDHERARLFKNYGIRTVEHFDATRCLRDSDSVVQEFLDLLL